MSVAVEIKNFSFWYGTKQALTDISVAVQPKLITAFIGPSGCGKSTLLRSVNRMNDLIPKTRHAGDIELFDRSVYAPDTDVVALRRRIGMVFQRPNPFPKTIFDNVAYGPRMNALCAKRELADRVEDALRRAALWDEVADRLDDLGTGLSGGQQQRLCIARALANDPEILLLDEPCSALDPIATQHIEELLLQLKNEVTIVIVTHNLHQAARIADETAFFYLGELVEFGRSEDLFTRPQNPRTEAYVTGRFG
ncbi:MAG TPA: phosphate ABC transporter ATP-binding protein PstB [Gemmatimonadales bacterium]|nr:phosphate ABC transporter ATP-binding protein PstB [Gemmatimonadales bacterium]